MYNQIEIFRIDFVFYNHRIQVQLDGNEYGIDQYGARIPVDVFQSTTIRELRAVVNENILFFLEILISFF
jgi:hypothetical protein